MVGRPSAWNAVKVDVGRRTVLAPKSAVADLLGANKSWLSSADIPPVEPELLDVRVAARKYIEYREGIAKRRALKEAAETDEEQALRIAKLRAQVEKQELENQQTRRELVDVAELGGEWTRALTAFRAALEVIPRRLAAEHGIDAKVERAAHRLIADALRELADLSLDDSDEGDADEVAAGSTPAAEPDAE